MTITQWIWQLAMTLLLIVVASSSVKKDDVAKTIFVSFLSGLALLALLLTKG